MAMQRMRWYQVGGFSLILALGLANRFLFGIAPEESGYWFFMYPEFLGVILLTVVVYQRVEEGRVDWFGIASQVLVLARYCAAALLVAVAVVFLLRSFFVRSWLDTLNLALVPGIVLSVVVILVLVTLLSRIEHRSLGDVLLNVRRDNQETR
jgi:hypothetical protein